jgi:predicted HD phosphohydrolase
MSEHMLQGAVLAEKEGAPEELVAAALLHDIGHYTSEFGTMSLGDARDNHHEESGAKVLEPFLPAGHHRIREAACAGQALSLRHRQGPLRPAVRSLEAHPHAAGRPDDGGEVAAFETNPFHREAVKVRIWDDEGKKPGVETPDFRHYVPLLKRVVARHEA